MTGLIITLLWAARVFADISFGEYYFHGMHILFNLIYVFYVSLHFSGAALLFLDNFGIENVRDSDLVALAYMTVFIVLFGFYVCYGSEFCSAHTVEISLFFLFLFFSKYTKMYIYKM